MSCMVLSVFIVIRSILLYQDLGLATSSIIKKVALKSMRNVAWLSLTLLSIRMVLFVIGIILLR
jgi:hypothetical protein